MTDCESRDPNRGDNEDELEGIMSTDCEIDQNTNSVEEDLELPVSSETTSGSHHDGKTSDIDLPMGEIPHLDEDYPKSGHSLDTELDNDYITRQINGNEDYPGVYYGR